MADIDLALNGLAGVGARGIGAADIATRRPEPDTSGTSNPPSFHA